MNNKTLFKSFTLSLMIILFIGCNRNSGLKSGKNISQGTGFGINSKDGGFQYDNKYKGQITGPGLVFVEGGTFTKGDVKDNVMHDWNNTPTQQYIRSFFIDETEVTNLMYLEYIDWMKKVFSDIENLRPIYRAALPDTLVWRNPLGFNEDMVDNYFRHPAFQNHPVVGVSWEQASRYAKWRTDRVNEVILVSKGLLKMEAIQADSLQDGYSFNTDAYYLDPTKAYGGRINEVAGDKSKETNEEGEETVKHTNRQDGILLPEYRLPTETEWEYAALALSEIRAENVYRGKKKFPWDGEYTRSGKKRNLGDQLANFKLSAGDYGGIAGWSEKGSGITTGVRSYPPNDFGLYGMAGNVAEWVADVYRPIIDEGINDFNYYRGNVYTNPSIGDDGKVITIDPDSATFDNLPGSVKEELVSDSIRRNNYSVADNINYNDGDITSLRSYKKVGEGDVEDSMYDAPTGKSDESTTNLIDDEARVFKGGSWLDRAYYLDPAQRRFLPQKMTNNFIGFRCAMSVLGDNRNAKKPRRR